MWLYSSDEFDREFQQFRYSLYRGCEYEEGGEVFGTELLTEGACHLEVDSLNGNPYVREVLWFFKYLLGKDGWIEYFRDDGWGRLAYCIRAEDGERYLLELEHV